MAVHSSVLAWRIPWTEEPGELQSMGSPRVGHNGATNSKAMKDTIAISMFPFNINFFLNFSDWHLIMFISDISPYQLIIFS